MVPLGSLLDVKRSQGSELITRYNLYPAAAIFGQAAPGFSSGQALHAMEELADRVLPRGMGYDWTATSYQEKQVGYQAYFIYALSITLVFMVLAALYESWTSPAAVILAVPMALVGVLVALLLRGYDNNLYTQIGLVLMIALASKNAILIVEFARDLRREGHVHNRGCHRSNEPAVSAHRDDLLCLHPGGCSAALCHRGRRCRPTGNRHGSLWRHALLDPFGDPVCAGFLRDHAAPERETLTPGAKNQRGE